MLREELGHIVASAVDRLIESGGVPAAVRGPVEILDTKQPEHGDYACNFALAASKAAGRNPRELAEKLRTAILEVDEAGVGEPNPQARRMVAEGSPPHPDSRPALIHEIDIAGPGFLNIRLKPESVAAYLATVLQVGNDLPKQGRNTATPQGRAQRINVEFVSVNPNGPITVGSARGAAFGDTLCRVLEARGNRVQREYYVNDGVNSEQMRQFAESVRHYYHAAAGIDSAFPEKGYHGDYVADLGREIHSRHGEGHDRELAIWFQVHSQELMLERQRGDLHAFGVDFDTWFSEQSLHDSGVVGRCIEELVAKGAADEEAYRIVLKMARGGVIEAVERQSQAEGMEEDGEEVEHGAPSPPPGGSSSAMNRAVESADESAHSKEARTLWLRSTKFGDDMDRVLRRQDGRLTYIASDVAYHRDKLTDESGVRGTGPVDKLITILGPDHHGYIHRLQAVLAALLEKPQHSQAPAGDGGAGSPHSKGGSPHAESSQDGCATTALDSKEAEIFRSVEEREACRAALEEARRKLEVVIFQIVRFVKDGKPAPMRKRDGNIYELRDLITELGQAVAASATKEEQQRIGADVARFFYLMRSHETSMDFDIDLATKQSDDNPVFYVQYAHARICSVIEKAREAGIGVFGYWGVGDAVGGDPNIPIPQHPNTLLLVHPRETTLIKKILDLPMEVKRCADDYGVHRLTTYAIELARTFHHFYDACRVIQPEEPELTQARLALCEAARIALKGTLDLLGVSAPARMEREAGRGVE